MISEVHGMNKDYDFLGFFHVIFFTMQEMGMVYGVLLKSSK
jgi:hypothetical protein